MVKTCFASVDVEKDLGQESFQGVENLEKISGIFKRYDVPATLFITGEVLQKYSDEFKELSSSHEIASHGFTHRFWNVLNGGERKKELADFINLYQQIFQKKPAGFRAPSHVIDKEGLELLDENGFLYDSSVVPHYPFFKKYRGYRGRAPLLPYRLSSTNIWELPVSGQFLGIPLAGAWIAGLPVWFYRLLFLFHRPAYITLNMHSWDILKPGFAQKLEEIVKILKKRNYQFKNGQQLQENRK
jgi:peptidoglycan/xylan/chitin deacetylase (PgdA/CDA1 family)